MTPRGRSALLGATAVALSLSACASGSQSSISAPARQMLQDDVQRLTQAVHDKDYTGAQQALGTLRADVGAARQRSEISASDQRQILGTATRIAADLKALEPRPPAPAPRPSPTSSPSTTPGGGGGDGGDGGDGGGGGD
ncbi:hypothetical protein ACFUC1_14305 [Pedococcus sp. NPDC057267]|uniref:hypothetical protein n=1 Tax=Pedococcus sp. NPDC057267 TaxID=3346077 RepID=UPI0036316D4C